MSASHSYWIGLLLLGVALIATHSHVRRRGGARRVRHDSRKLQQPLIRDASMSLILIETSTNRNVANLVDWNGMELSVEIPSSFNILARTNDPQYESTIQSVIFDYKLGRRPSARHIDNSAPPYYSLCGYERRRGRRYPSCPSLVFRTSGRTPLSLTATPYSGVNGTGEAGPTVTVTLTLVTNNPTMVNCSIPQFIGDWESLTPYPLTVAEAQGAVMGSDLVLISGFHNGYDQSTAHTYALNVQSNDATWRRRDDIPVEVGITHGAFVVVRDVLYMCGGYVGGHPGPDTNQCWVYNHSQSSGQQWSSLSPLPEGRAGGGLIYDGQRRFLVFAGGARRPEAGNPDAFDFNTTWSYSLDNPSAGWIRKADMPFLANHMSFVTAIDPNTQQERHFFLGGQVGENEYTGNVADNFEWDVAREVWIRRASMPVTRGHAASSTRAVGCGFIIAAGSTNEAGKTADVSYYDLPTDTWISMGSLPNAINTPVCDIHQGYLYCESGWPTGSFSYRRQIAG